MPFLAFTASYDTFNTSADLFGNISHQVCRHIVDVMDILRLWCLHLKPYEWLLRHWKHIWKQKNQRSPPKIIRSSCSTSETRSKSTIQSEAGSESLLRRIVCLSWAPCQNSTKMICFCKNVHKHWCASTGMTVHKNTGTHSQQCSNKVNHSAWGGKWVPPLFFSWGEKKKKKQWWERSYSEDLQKTIFIRSAFVMYPSTNQNVLKGRHNIALLSSVETLRYSTQSPTGQTKDSFEKILEEHL